MMTVVIRGRRQRRFTSLRGKPWPRTWLGFLVCLTEPTTREAPILPEPGRRRRERRRLAKLSRRRARREMYEDQVAIWGKQRVLLIL